MQETAWRLVFASRQHDSRGEARSKQRPRGYRGQRGDWDSCRKLNTKQREVYPRFSCGAFRDGGLAAARREERWCGTERSKPRAQVGIICGSGDEVEGGAEEDEQRSRGSRASRHSGLCCLEMGIRLGRSHWSRRVVKCRAWQSAKMRW